MDDNQVAKHYQRTIRWLYFLIICCVTVGIGAILTNDMLMFKIIALDFMFVALIYGCINQGIEFTRKFDKKRDWILGESFVLWQE